MTYEGRLKLNREDCKQIAKKDWRLVEEVYLNDNLFGDEGCEHLASACWP